MIIDNVFESAPEEEVTNEPIAGMENPEFPVDPVAGVDGVAQETEFQWVDEVVKDSDLGVEPIEPQETEYTREDGIGAQVSVENTDSENLFIPDDKVGASADPYASGFDEDHPKPTYQELRNAGFTKFEANQILYGPHDSYSEKELFECLYSENPKEAYDAMMRQKTDELLERIDRTLANI